MTCLQCYVVAKTHEFSCVEEYVQNLANFLLDKYSFVRQQHPHVYTCMVLTVVCVCEQLTRVWAHAVEDKWERAVDPKGRAHNHGELATHCVCHFVAAPVWCIV